MSLGVFFGLSCALRYFLLMVVAYATCSPPQLERAKLYLRKGDAPLGDWQRLVGSTEAHRKAGVQLPHGSAGERKMDV